MGRASLAVRLGKRVTTSPNLEIFFKIAYFGIKSSLGLNLHRDCCPKLATGLKCFNGHRSKKYMSDQSILLPK